MHQKTGVATHDKAANQPRQLYPTAALCCRPVASHLTSTWDRHDRVGRRGTMRWAGEAQWERHDGVCERGFVNLTERLCQLHHSKGQERGKREK